MYDDDLACLSVSQEELSTQDRLPYKRVIGISGLNLSILLTIGFLAQPKCCIIAWNALSPLFIENVKN